MMYILVYLFIINVIGFLIMLADKKKAKKGSWRIPEAVLLGVAAAFGAGGVWAGMDFFHHKTRHRNFYLGVPVLFFFELAILALLIIAL